MAKRSDEDFENDEELTRLVPLSEKERDQAGRKLAAAHQALLEVKKRNKLEKKRMKAKEEKAEAEVETLSRAVHTGQIEEKAQTELELS